MRMPWLLGPSLLVAAVLSTSALPPAEHLRIVPAGPGRDGISTERPPPLAAMTGPTTAGMAIAGRRIEMGPLQPCDDPLAGPALRLLSTCEPHRAP